MHQSNNVDSRRCYQCVKFLVTLAQKWVHLRVRGHGCKGIEILLAGDALMIFWQTKQATYNSEPLFIFPTRCSPAKDYFKDLSGHWSWAVQWLQKKASLNIVSLNTAEIYILHCDDFFIIILYTDFNLGCTSSDDWTLLDSTEQRVQWDIH